MSEKSYWNKFYYSNNELTSKPSSFCLFVDDFFKDRPNLNILDAGFGNGRDSYHLSKSHNVIGIDMSTYLPKDGDNCKFITADFCNYDKSRFDLIYSRFTFHAITNRDQSIFLKSIWKKNTFLCIEARSDLGKNQNRYFGDDHYRNFINKEGLKNALKEYGFQILYFKEGNDMAIYKDENPICIRLICKKI
jgi:ubiquinone/menaquinone biosynthesis C-methylase UbiE